VSGKSGESMRKKVFTLILLAINLAVIVAIGFIDPHLKELGGAFKTIDPLWLLGGVALMFGFWSMDAFKFLASLRLIVGAPHRFFTYLKIAIIGQYYCAITPFSTGGQPMQVYYFSRYGVPGGISTSVLVIQYVILLICHSIVYIIAFAARSGMILSHAPGLFPFAVLGLILLFGLIFSAVAMSSHSKRLKKILYGGLKLFHRFRIVKQPLRQWRRLHHAVDDFQNGLRLLHRDKKTMAWLFLLTIVQLACFFSIPYFVYRSLGLSEASWLDMTLVGAFIQVMVSYFPTPGASGASEGAFYAFYPIFFPAPFIFLAMLMWRILSYYSNIAVGALLVFLDGVMHITRERTPIHAGGPARDV
jgi:uncharacterized protein (TIRG00374 family)